MNGDVLFFFEKHPDALPLYEKLQREIFSRVEGVSLKVQATQISFYNRHLFACVSFSRVRRKKDCPPSYIVVTFGLEHQVMSPRIDAATEPYPNRWTHHVLVSRLEEIDEELMGWLREAAAFAQFKR